jgi:hypothetical protein
VEGVWRCQGYGGGAWQVSGGRRRPVVLGLHEDRYPDRRAEDITKCGAEAGAWEQDDGALGGFENGGKIAEAFLVGQVVCCGLEASRRLPGMSSEEDEAVPAPGENAGLAPEGAL